MKALLFSVPASHPSWTARLMLELKGIDYTRVDLVLVLSKPILRLAGFPGVTVPALRIGRVRVQGSRAIGRELDRLVADPPLFPDDPVRRAKVEEAELWGDEVLQSAARRIAWNLLSKDTKPIEGYLKGARLGMPVSVAARTSLPIARLSARFNDATDTRVVSDLAELPAMLNRIDAYIADGTIGGDPPNAADLQIATSVALLATFEDLEPLIEGRPAGELARRLVPDFPGRTPPGFPAAWLEPVRQATAP